LMASGKRNVTGTIIEAFINRFPSLWPYSG
jgi:hypothetical protein